MTESRHQAPAFLSKAIPATLSSSIQSGSSDFNVFSLSALLMLSSGSKAGKQRYVKNRKHSHSVFPSGMREIMTGRRTGQFGSDSSPSVILLSANCDHHVGLRPASGTAVGSIVIHTYKDERIGSFRPLLLVWIARSRENPRPLGTKDEDFSNARNISL